MNRLWLRSRRFIFHNILHADDTPHRIAMGAAVGGFVAMLPLIGLQTIISVAVAALIRVNKAICIPVVWITNPATMVPIYAGCLYLGRWLLPAKIVENPEVLDVAEITLHLSAYTGWRRFIELGYWQDVARTMLGLGVELWVGCAVAGTLVGVLFYFGVRYLVVHHRRRHAERLRRRIERREMRRAARAARNHVPFQG